MEQKEYEVVIQRTETCRVCVLAQSEDEARERALALERDGKIDNHVYSNELVDARLSDEG